MIIFFCHKEEKKRSLGLGKKKKFTFLFLTIIKENLHFSITYVYVSG